MEKYPFFEKTKNTFTNGIENATINCGCATDWASYTLCMTKKA
jgi:hypothetical protein